MPLPDYSSIPSDAFRNEVFLEKTKPPTLDTEKSIGWAICSGDMYAIVPTAVPGLVRCSSLITVGATPSDAATTLL
jgi:hypothetical protein